LPSFPFDFHDSATVLKRLELQCTEDEGPDRTSIALPVTDHEEFECPKLYDLVVDGRNYYEACRRDARWMDKISSVTELTISVFKPRPGESFSSEELLLPLAAVGLDHLRIAGLILHPYHPDIL
jgi:hypothetical protein